MGNLNAYEEYFVLCWIFVSFTADAFIMQNGSQIVISPFFLNEYLNHGIKKKNFMYFLNNNVHW